MKWKNRAEAKGRRVKQQFCIKHPTRKHEAEPGRTPLGCRCGANIDFAVFLRKAATFTSIQDQYTEGGPVFIIYHGITDAHAHARCSAAHY